MANFQRLVKTNRDYLQRVAIYEVPGVGDAGVVHKAAKFSSFNHPHVEA